VPIKEEEEEGGCIKEEDNDHLFDPDDGVARSRLQPDPTILYPTSTPTCTGTGGVKGSGRGGTRRRCKSSTSLHRVLDMPKDVD